MGSGLSIARNLDLQLIESVVVSPFMDTRTGISEDRVQISRAVRKRRCRPHFACLLWYPGHMCALESRSEPVRSFHRQKALHALIQCSTRFPLEPLASCILSRGFACRHILSKIRPSPSWLIVPYDFQRMNASLLNEIECKKNWR